ncbi:hypothetical protein [Okeania sp.]|uniref:hypothetical protein n=1 Tax=Okeania sp. TaxID=3100323 RepID=UPI002B4B29F8|nr:hypothetical protein [Okeania sp.]MEB3342965.1 hypothetical protein [Okeania sp.]
MSGYQIILLITSENEGDESAIQFEVAINQGIVEIIDFDSEAEAETFINYTARIDDGEAATCAIAVCRE